MRIVMLATVAALAGVSAAAQEIGTWDLSSDGLLDEAEFTEGILDFGAFDRWDLDEDDLVGFSELASGLHDLWDPDEDGELSVDEWDNAVDLWLGEQDVNLSVEVWDENGDGIISEAEFAEGLQQTDLLTRLETVGDDSLLEEEEFASGLFDVADGDEGPGLLDNQKDRPLTVLDEALMQLPIHCAGAGESCQQVVHPICETLGYGEPIAFLDVANSPYTIRCEDEI